MPGIIWRLNVQLSLVPDTVMAKQESPQIHTTPQRPHPRHLTTRRNSANFNSQQQLESSFGRPLSHPSHTLALGLNQSSQICIGTLKKSSNTPNLFHQPQWLHDIHIHCHGLCVSCCFLVFCHLFFCLSRGVVDTLLCFHQVCPGSLLVFQICALTMEWFSWLQPLSECEAQWTEGTDFSSKIPRVSIPMTICGMSNPLTPASMLST